MFQSKQSLHLHSRRVPSVLPCVRPKHPLNTHHPRRTVRTHVAQPSTHDKELISDRLDALRQERSRLLAQLSEVDRSLRSEVLEDTRYSPASSEWMPDINFGFIRQFSGEPFDLDRPAGVPGGILEMGAENFLREGREMLAQMGFSMPTLLRGGVGIAPPALTPTVLERQVALQALTLNAGEIWEREHRRPEVVAPWIIKAPYYILCWVLDVVFEGRPIPRFWFLETVARMPYLSYITMLHFYETVGWWRRSYEARKVHFAEEMNESHHLLIMESLGGDQRWSDRFAAQHSAIIYFLVLCVLWLMSPTLAYNFSELIEAHAVDTYAQFADENEDLLRALPAPRVAKLYYESTDLYLFDAFQTSRPQGSRRERVDTLYDTFCCIRDDEGEHVATMAEVQDQDVLARAPNVEAVAFALLVVTLGAQWWLGQRGLMLGQQALEGTDADMEAAAAQLADVVSLEAVVDVIANVFRGLF